MSIENPLLQPPVSPVEQTADQLDRRTEEDPTSETGLVQALAKGGDVHFRYNEDFGIDITFRADGTTLVFDDQSKQIQPNRGMERYIKVVRTASGKFKEALSYIPHGNLERDFGGQDGLAEAFFRAESANAIVRDSKEEEAS